MAWMIRSVSGSPGLRSSYTGSPPPLATAASASAKYWLSSGPSIIASQRCSARPKCKIRWSWPWDQYPLSSFAYIGSSACLCASNSKSSAVAIPHSAAASSIFWIAPFACCRCGGLRIWWSAGHCLQPCRSWRSVQARKTEVSRGAWVTTLSLLIRCFGCAWTRSCPLGRLKAGSGCAADAVRAITVACKSSRIGSERMDSFWIIHCWRRPLKVSFRVRWAMADLSRSCSSASSLLGITVAILFFAGFSSWSFWRSIPTAHVPNLLWLTSTSSLPCSYSHHQSIPLARKRSSHPSTRLKRPRAGSMANWKWMQVGCRDRHLRSHLWRWQFFAAHWYFLTFSTISRSWHWFRKRLAFTGHAAASFW